MRKLGRAALAVDAWVNSALYESGQRARERYTNFAAFMDRFHVSGAKRGAVELSCEALTIGTAGSVLLLALAIPAFNETSEDWLKQQDLAVTFLDRYGKEVGRRGIRHNDSLTLDELPEIMIQAALATEDRRFWTHWGIDPIGTARALTANVQASGVVQGGSTITQQLAKNLFLTNERSIERKIREAYLAIWLEARLTKREILKLYLDRAYMGGGNFGVQAASEFYFGKSVREVSLAEAAMLAGLFKAPTRYAPHINLPAARARANNVLSNMVEAGFLTEGQITIARRNPATPVDRHDEASADWYLDWAYEEIKKLAGAGKLGADRVLTVRTALDTSLQRRAQEAVEDNLRQSGPRYRATQGASVVMEPNGAVRAIVGGRDYGESQFNRATGALRQPGSSFKPFVYATAMMVRPNLRPTTLVTDSPICLGNWCPKNYGGSFAGRVPLIRALASSYNTVAVKLSVDAGDGRNNWDKARSGRSRIVDLSRRMGLTTPLNDTVSLPIGAGEVHVLDMAAAYAVFANGGYAALPFAAVEVRNSAGDVIYRRDPDNEPRERLLTERVVADMNMMMSAVVHSGTARRAILPGIPTAGKTGTTNAYRDAWFVGFSANYVTAVWYGNDNYRPMNNMTGGSVPAQTWYDIMSFAHQGIELRSYPGADTKLDPSAAVAGLAARPGAAQLGAPQRPVTLSRQSIETLGRIEKFMQRAGERMKRI
ncbi:MAG: PBP1A family penicillin-binding protein [Alphaproteobacteria bacterium]|nr:PBP1A family penicillin-binding protein [Alphaproteobacteria bacterium]